MVASASPRTNLCAALSYSDRPVVGNASSFAFLPPAFSSVTRFDAPPISLNSCKRLIKLGVNLTILLQSCFKLQKL